jgi:hypothetical protein
MCCLFRGTEIETWKWLTIHGLATSYKVSAFKFTAEGSEILQRSGFGTKPPFHTYIGIMVWGPRTRFIIDDSHGYAKDAIAKAGLDDCCVLEEGVSKILRSFDELENGNNIEVGRNGPNAFWTKVTKRFVW